MMLMTLFAVHNTFTISVSEGHNFFMITVVAVHNNFALIVSAEPFAVIVVFAIVSRTYLNRMQQFIPVKSSAN
jgi:uncharacterized membrane protein